MEADMVLIETMSDLGPPQDLLGTIEVMLTALIDRIDLGRLERDDLAEQINRAIELMERHATVFPHVAPRVPLACAGLAHWSGDEQGAIDGFGAAIELAAATGLLYDVARFTVAWWLLGIGGDRPDLDEARAVLDRLGAKRWLARADAVRR
jgi:hypothetical protein